MSNAIANRDLPELIAVAEQSHGADEGGDSESLDRPDDPIADRNVAHVRQTPRVRPPGDARSIAARAGDVE
jgi:hypothetical protein